MANEKGEEAKEGEAIEELKIERPPRARLPAGGSLKRMEEFPSRREKFIAAVRKGKG